MANVTIGSSQAISSTTVTKPTGVVDGSVLVIRYQWFCAADQHLVHPTCSDSFVDVGSISWYDVSHTYSYGVSFFRKVIASAAGEPATYTITPVTGRDVDLGMIVRLVNCDTSTPETDAGSLGIPFGGFGWSTGAVIDSGAEDLLLSGSVCWTASLGTPATMTQDYLQDGGDIGGYSENPGVLSGATRSSTTGGAGNDGSATAFVVFKAATGGVAAASKFIQSRSRPASFKPMGDALRTGKYRSWR